MPQSREWFREAFDDIYLTVYRHRDPGEARRIIEALAPSVRLNGAAVLDLASGSARFHEPVMAAGASFYLGVDLSAPLLRSARAAGEDVVLVRADMRALPLTGGGMDVVLSMFTSFGYFESDEENQIVLGEIARVLRPGGRFLVDLMNPGLVARTLVPASERDADGLRIAERRAIEGNRVVKDVRIHGIDGETLSAYRESVRIVDPDELIGWAGVHRLTPRTRWGDYDGGAFDPEGSPRLIMLFEKEGA